jgi:hypothetical protein
VKIGLTGFRERGSTTVRRIISLACATALLVASCYALYVFLFEAAGFKVGWAAGAGVMLVLALYWIWEDFMHPLGKAPEQ